MFEATKHQGEFEITDIVDIDEDPVREGEYVVQVEWVGLNPAEERSWEPVSTIH